MMATTFQIGEEFFAEPDETSSARRFGTNLELRAARWADLEPVAQLILDVCTNDGDATIAVPPEELRAEWETPGFTLESDAWVVTAADGRVVGYEEFVNKYAHASLQGDGYVHPDFMGQGIGTAMLRALEERARQEMTLAEPEQRVFIRNGMSIGDTVAREMHEAEGYNLSAFSGAWKSPWTQSRPPRPGRKASNCVRSSLRSTYLRGSSGA